MKKKLSSKEYIYVASMLFGLFFGAGNLIFPPFLGLESGSQWVSGSVSCRRPRAS